MKLTITAVLTLAWLAAPSSAQDREPEAFPSRGLTLGPRFSAFKPDGGGEWTGFVGAQARLHLSPVWAVEGAADYRRRLIPGGKVQTYPVTASLVAYLMPNRFRLVPFILVGGGWHFTRIEGPTADDTSNRAGGHAGGGLQLFLNRKWSLDASYRHYWLEDLSRGNVLNQSLSDDGHHLTAALNFHF